MDDASGQSAPQPVRNLLAATGAGMQSFCVLLERSESLLPVRVHLVEPVAQRCKGVECHAIQADASVMFDAILNDESCFAQHAQMATQRRWTHLHALRQLSRPQRLAAQFPYHSPARRIRKRGEGAVEISSGSLHVQPDHREITS